jgi:hypothetical protein
MQVESSFELSSDHSPVIATMSTYVISKPTMPTLIKKQTNWDSFCTYIEEHINLNLRIKEPNELEVTQYFTTLIQEAAWYSTPTPQEERKKTDNIPFHICELVTEKRRAQTRWQRSRNNDMLIYNRVTD